MQTLGKRTRSASSNESKSKDSHWYHSPALSPIDVSLASEDVGNRFWLVRLKYHFFSFATANTFRKNLVDVVKMNNI